MKPDFWIERWQENRIGFHRDEVNPNLIATLGALNLEPGDRVFLPLCGKSLDITWLADQGFEVIGVEISPLAVEQLFAIQGLRPSVCRVGNVVQYSTDNLRIYCGDVFDLAPGDLGNIAAVYDRAALIALPENMRRDYVDRIRYLAPSARTLLVTLDYPQHEMTGPPFAVSDEEVQALYGSEYAIKRLIRTDALDAEPGFRAQGLSALVESVYLLQPGNLMGIES
ncbi:MAG: thiopurine S-methyltransferase [Gammaproteobacteria bacterium]|nr:MAG: thiopurine S-methyltransferase [Gammaproteobacteria bacterium]